MNDQMTVALISGGAALVVAVVGIAGAIAAQLLATRRAFQNSLALFDRQDAAQRQTWLEQIRREDLHRFAGQKRDTYGRLLRLASNLVVAREAERTAAKYLERKQRQLDRGGEQTPALLDEIEQQEQTAVDERDRTQRLSAQLDEIVDELQLLASAPVHAAAEALREGANNASHLDADDYRQARSAFLAAARLELGIQGPRSEPKVDRLPHDPSAEVLGFGN